MLRSGVGRSLAETAGRQPDRQLIISVAATGLVPVVATFVSVVMVAGTDVMVKRGQPPDIQTEALGRAVVWCRVMVLDVMLVVVFVVMLWRFVMTRIVDEYRMTAVRIVMFAMVIVTPVGGGRTTDGEGKGGKQGQRQQAVDCRASQRAAEGQGSAARRADRRHKLRCGLSSCGIHNGHLGVGEDGFSIRPVI